MLVLKLATNPPLTSTHPFLHPLFLLTLLNCVSSNTLVTVKLNKYINTDNLKDQDDQFCNVDESPCNIEFVVRLMAPIKYAFTIAPQVVTEITFSDTITANDGTEQPNPFPGTQEEQNVTEGFSSVDFVIHLWHLMDNGDATRVARLSHRRQFSTWGAETANISDDLGHSSIDITTTIECAPDYYPRPVEELSTEVSNCTYCVETDQYTCNQEDGSRVCKEGWQGVNCDTAIPENCPAIEESNSTISPTTYKTDSLNVGYTLTFTCPGPYLSYLSSSPFMTCLESGQWNSSVPSCVPVVDNIDQKMISLRNVGLFILAGVVVTFTCAVTIMTYTINYMGQSAANSGQYFKNNVSHQNNRFSPSHDFKKEKSGFAEDKKSGFAEDKKSGFAEEEEFPPDYTDKTHLVTKGGEKEYDIGGKKQNIQVNLNSLDLGVEDVDF